jgi:biotin transport system substrate-specific component
MSATTATTTTHRPRTLVLADVIPGGLTRDTALVLAGAGLVGLLAQISVHLSFTPVPITGQTLGVLLTGTALGWRRGTAAMVLYAVAGAFGVPWFAGGASGYVGANFGYIVGFILSALICGRLAELGGDRRMLSSVPSMLVGEIAMYSVGVAWLALDLHVGAGRAIALGLTPFIWSDVIKATIAALVLPSAWKLLGTGTSGAAPPRRLGD